ncbi:diguanylate cyclase domain-containing protein [Marinobacterium rhizophilum]|uniref:Sensor domain-containing diguanylate cyclase n=1 Tax=Marinobacterium rhizophilum TaxID=420402 RepID=A0ABY5HN75_9GAMM|nr:diguanylate cyclase [Marinobacterium rhizophilum]UTW13887.1 sensor domain-containing diguanylate cyclase [Marinobacterium rhizophilum]
MALCGILGTEFVAGLANQRDRESVQLETQVELSELRVWLESEINSVLYLTRGLTAYIVARPQATPAEFAVVVPYILRGSDHVRNIGLAPNNRIRFVYPLAGNEAALGLDYTQDSQQWPAIARAIEHGDMLVSGPLQLVQGGSGLIARSPVFVDVGKDSRYWGLVSIVIDMDSLLAAAGLNDNPRGIALRGTDGLGARGMQFFGPAGVFESADVLTLPVNFRHGQWEIGVVPDPRLQGQAGMRTRGLLYALLLAIVVLLLQLIQVFCRARHQATIDALTGLPNRRMLLERAGQLIAQSRRNNSGFALCYVDLNGFKPVNDRYGHHAGDQVLQEVAVRLRRALRVVDTVARTGGDEFVLLLPGIESVPHVDAVLQKLSAVMRVPVLYKGENIVVGASMGWALFASEADTLDALMALADSRMYEMKENFKAVARSARAGTAMQ